MGWAGKNKGGGGGGGTSKYQKDIDTMEHGLALREDNIDAMRDEVEALEALDKKYRDVHGNSTLSLEDERDLEERLYEAREDLREQELEDAYDLIDHKKAMGDLSVQQEIEMLEQIRDTYEMTADEIEDINEEIYGLQQDLIDEQAESLDDLANGIIDALDAKYEAMRESELDALDASRDAWDKWEDDNVAAIQSQIDALDELAAAEDREAEDADELRKIAKLQAAIAFEQDEYNRAQLQKQLDDAVAEREDTLADRERDDQIASLQDQQDAIRDQADAARDALDDQEDAVNQHYDDLTTDAALEAEAEAMLMAGNQQAILDLMASYGDDYNATGQSLGEQWLHGFDAAVGELGESVSAWITALNQKIADLQDNITATAAAAANNVATTQTSQKGMQSTGTATPGAASVTYEQTVNFNQPIETPSDVTRRLTQASVDLARTVTAGL
jgi:hypothetical protein